MSSNAYYNALSDSLKSIIESINRATNNDSMKIIKEAQSIFIQRVQAIIDNSVPKIDLPLSYKILSKSFEAAANMMSIINNKDSASIDEQEQIVNAVESAIKEIPESEREKEELVSYCKPLKKKEPWSRSDKINLIALLLIILQFLQSVNTNINEKDNTTQNNNTYIESVNINIQNETTVSSDNIEQFNNLQARIENIEKAIQEIIIQLNSEESLAEEGQDNQEQNDQFLSESNKEDDL